MRNALVIAIVSVLTAGIIDAFFLNKSIKTDERAYKFGCADRWLDQNGRNNKQFHWTSYTP